MRTDSTTIVETGSYTASVLGNIRAHLAGLQGFSIMALELIQNADDANAERLVFDVTNEALVVWNDAEFTYCGHLKDQSCPHEKSQNYACDFHRITEVASGGKLAKSENIGRFGIGFLSTYQITDRPEIQSTGITITLFPENREWQRRVSAERDGTKFVLPWALDPNSQTRSVLNLSHITHGLIDKLVEDFQGVLRRSLLFLRHLRTVELRRNNDLILACDLERDSDSSELIVSYRPINDIEQWHILRVNASVPASDLFRKYQHLEKLNRNALVSIAIRVEPQPLENGYLYAYLPTEQPTGLPLHINADFFPESNRKNVVFSGLQHEESWNEMLINTAARELGRDLEELLDKAGYKQLWEIISRALNLFNDKSKRHPSCFTYFWDELKKSALKGAKIALTSSNTFEQPSNILISRQPLEKSEDKVLQELGIKVCHEDLRPHRNALLQLGAHDLTIERLVDFIERSLKSSQHTNDPVSEERVKTFYEPLWAITNALLPDPNLPHRSLAEVKNLRTLPFILMQELIPASIKECYAIPTPLTAAKIAPLLSFLAIAHDDLRRFPRIFALFDIIDLHTVAVELQTQLEHAEMPEKVLGADRAWLKHIYSLFAQLDQIKEGDQDTYSILRSTPIWQTGRGLLPADQVLLPGNFTDPTGQAGLLDKSLFEAAAREFIEKKLGIERQTVEAFVRTFVPNFFGGDVPINVVAYQRLISQLSDHSSLLNNEELRDLLSKQRLVPTRDGEWVSPKNSYFRTEKLVEILGESKHLWIDETRLPNTRSVRSFLENLGIRKSPSATHLVERLCQIAENNVPNDEARKASERVFYVLCDHYDEWAENHIVQQALEKLEVTECLPAEDDKDKWYQPSDLYAPYRADAFRSQANILDFKNTKRLSTSLLEDLGISIEPETDLVIDHLLHCAEVGQQAHVSVYIILNERSAKGDHAISRLIGTSCIFVERINKYVRPNQLYWMTQQLGQYAFTVPPSLEQYKALFTSLGVKDSPAPKDYIDILLDIIGDHFDAGKAVVGTDLAIYNNCLFGLTESSTDSSTLSPADWHKLKTSPSVLNLLNRPCFPDEVLLSDSEWHANFYGTELNQALCKPAPEYWEIFKELGVKRLSDSAQVSLEFVDGEENSEGGITRELKVRTEIIIRLLHDKSTAIKHKVSETLTTLSARSYDLVHIQATVALGNEAVTAAPASVAAFYDPKSKVLTLSRPINERSWVHIFNAIFHQAMPNENAAEISKLSSHLGLLMRLGLTEAHETLTDAGIPLLSPEEERPEDLNSQDLGDIGVGVPGEETEQGETLEPSDGDDNEISDIENKGNEMDESLTSKPIKRHRSRPKHKEQWDRRLLSYVHRKCKPDDTSGTQPVKDVEHNLAVEVAARKAVCNYELARGRVPKEMPQTNPGYDIISRNLTTGEERYIEVKGINGEWNNTGVGLSHLQFSNAQDYGNQYWLYVVEHAFEPDVTEVHPIQSPASKVDSFMFDKNWQEAASDEAANPAALFVPGAQIDCGPLGIGTIISVDRGGYGRTLIVDFGDSGKKILPFDLRIMKLIDLEQEDIGL